MEGNNLTDTEKKKKILSAGYFSKELTKIFTSNELAEKYKEIKTRVFSSSWFVKIFFAENPSKIKK